MKTFMYRGYDRDGGRVRGVVEAMDVKDAREKLSRLAILPDQVSPASEAAPVSGTWMGRQDTLARANHRAEFYRALSTMLKAGLPLVSSLEVLLEQSGMGQPIMARDIARLRDRVRDGDDLVSALQRSSIPINAFEWAVIESGERTGSLHVVLEQLAEYLDDMSKISQSLRTACLYPAIIVALAFIVGVGVMGFLVPQMATLFEESGMTLPLITRLVIALGTWFLPVVLPILLLILIFLTLTFKRMLTTSNGRIACEKWMSHLPVIRQGFKLLVSLRFARTSSLLLQGGVPLVDMVSLAGRATGSHWLSLLAEKGAGEIKHGASFSNVINSIPVLGSSLGSWVRAGEASGDLASMFHHAAERQRYAWAGYMERMVTLIEPILIIIVAVFVLMVALAILLPILSLNQNLA